VLIHAKEKHHASYLVWLFSNCVVGGDTSIASTTVYFGDISPANWH